MRTTRPALGRRTLLGTLALAIPAAPALAGCSAEPAVTDAGQDLLRGHDLEGLSAREVIDHLEALPLPERPQDLLASVLPESLSLSDATGTEISLPLPEGESYISIAPFVEATHECFFHSLTTCLGELQETEIEVTATAADGTTLLDEVRATAPNGFLGLWLPRDEELTVTLAHEGASASGPLLTDAEAPTCVTTMQLRS
ncbi:MAG: CueP family metal-binding protein [Brachybacterium sp.]